MRLPLFPLDLVVFPHARLPLHVFEPRYRRLLRHLLALPPQDRRFGIVAPHRSAAGGDSALLPAQGPHPGSGLRRVGTVVVLRDVDYLDVDDPDSSADVVVDAVERFVLREVVETPEPFAVAEVDVLPPPAGDATTGDVRRALGDYVSGLGSATGQALSAGGLPTDPDVLAWGLADLPTLVLEERQVLLEAPDLPTLVASVTYLLRREGCLLASTRSVPALDLASASPQLN